jgi:hypothetical protein
MVNINGAELIVHFCFFFFFLRQHLCVADLNLVILLPQPLSAGINRCVPTPAC